MANPSRRLRRQGAVVINSAGGQAFAGSTHASPPVSGTLGKRLRGSGGDEDGSATDIDAETSSVMGATTLPRTSSRELEALVASPAASAGHASATVLRYASAKKLRLEQREELGVFLVDAPLVREGKLLATLLRLENKLDGIRSSAPAYQLSEELKINISNYCVTVLLSANINAYKGDIPRNHVLDILKRFRLNLPTDIEHNYASWEKISNFVGSSLTQCRARLKKLVKEGIASNINIFILAQHVVHSTPCRPTSKLCARIALMRMVHVECEGSDKFWNLMDERLEYFRSQAGSSLRKLSEMFDNLLLQDRLAFGTSDDREDVDIVGSEWQEQVDEMVLGAINSQ